MQDVTIGTGPTQDRSALAADISATFGRVMVQAGQQAEYSGFRGRGPLVHRAAHHLATQDDAAADPVSGLSPQSQALWETFTAMWTSQLNAGDRLALYVHGLWISPHAPTIAEVLSACRLAGPPFEQPADELSRLQSGQVKATGSQGWTAELGKDAAALSLGDHASLTAAYEAVQDALARQHERLREVMTTGPGPLEFLAGMDWQAPSIDGWEAVQQDTAVLESDLVSIEEIARRAGVPRGTVGVWISRHSGRGFPAGLGGTTARSWTAVAKWLQANGKLPKATDATASAPADVTIAETGEGA